MSTPRETDPPTEPVAPERPVPPSTGRRPRDMAFSLLVILVPVLLLVGIFRWVQGGEEPVTVDPGPRVEQARHAGLPALEPTGLPDGWLPVTARFTRAAGGATLRLGYVAPNGDGVQVVQSGAPAETVLTTELAERPAPQGTEQLAGRTWQWYAGRPGERALVLMEPTNTVIVTGPVGDAELKTLAGSLR